MRGREGEGEGEGERERCQSKEGGLSSTDCICLRLISLNFLVWSWL